VSRAPSNLAFDDQGEVVCTVQPPADLGDVCPHCSRSYHEEGLTSLDVAEIREQAIREVLDFLTAGEVEVNRIGWRCSLTAWLVNRQESQRELAARLGVTEGRISQSLKSARDEIARFIRAKQGQASSVAKVRPHRYE